MPLSIVETALAERTLALVDLPSPSHEEGLGSSKSASNLRNAGLDEDIAWCARESVLDVVPRVMARVGASVHVA